MRLQQEIWRDIRWSMVFLVAFLGSLFFLFSIITISGAVVASGILVVKNAPKKVQHLTGGKIAKILVRDGDKVKQGQLLIKLDDTVAKSKVVDLTNQLMTAETQIKIKKNEKAVADRELNLHREMFAKRLSTIIEVNRLEKESLRAEADLDRLAGTVMSIQTQLKPAKDAWEQTDITAPISGIVHLLSVHTVGGVIGPQDQIMMIIPVDDALVVEAKIRPEDIDQVYPTQAVHMKITAFNSKIFHDLEGKLDTISPDVVVDNRTGSSYYIGRVSVTDTRSMNLIAGMTAETFIKTRERTIMNYLLKPISDQMFRSMRER